MIVSLLTGTGMFNISDFVPALARLDLQGVQAKLRRVHRQFDGLITKLLAEHAATAADRARQGRPDFVDRLRATMDAGAAADDESGETITEVNIKGLIFVSSLLFPRPQPCIIICTYILHLLGFPLVTN
jgi:flavonoid 3',5'-hydroxylase